jgi:hypothetical protein
MPPHKDITKDYWIVFNISTGYAMASKIEIIKMFYHSHHL